MINYVFLILHYKVVDETINCVNTLLSTFGNRDDFSIVIVENGSKNGSYELLLDRFNEDERVILLKSEENLGFANGNNIGFEYIKAHYVPRFVFMINNDLYISQSNFIEEVENIYLETSFYLLGPDETNNIQGMHNNPQKIVIKNRKDIVKQIKKIKFELFLVKMHLSKLVAIKNRLFRTKINRQDHLHEQTNVKLSGGCFIFSKDYLRDYGKLFSKTFIYGEEDILIWILNRDKRVVHYSPKIHVFHNEKVSTKSVNKTNRDRALFFYSNKLKSLQEFLKFVDSGEVIY